MPLLPIGLATNVAILNADVWNAVELKRECDNAAFVVKVNAKRKTVFTVEGGRSASQFRIV